MHPLITLSNVGVIWKSNATLQVYSTSFVRSSWVTEEKYLTTNLQRISPARV